MFKYNGEVVGSLGSCAKSSYRKGKGARFGRRRWFSLPIPAEPFEGKAPSLKKIFNADMKIYVTPDQYFTTKFREIFQKTKLRHTSAAESKQWLGGPKIKYWPQQLNFAVYCSTQGCGVSREIFDSGLDLPPQIRAFYIFHVYFTIRRILYQLGSIQGPVVQKRVRSKPRVKPA